MNVKKVAIGHLQAVAPELADAVRGSRQSQGGDLAAPVTEAELQAVHLPPGASSKAAHWRARLLESFSRDTKASLAGAAVGLDDGIATRALNLVAATQTQPPKTPQKACISGAFATAVANACLATEAAPKPLGKVAWNNHFGQRATAIVMLRNGLSVVTGVDNHLRAYDLEGRIHWSLPLRANLSQASVSPDGTIFVIEDETVTDTSVVAVSPMGELLWRKELTGLLLPTRPAIGPDGSLFIGAHGGLMVALDRDGKEKWQKTIGRTGGRISSPSIAADGTMYVAERVGRVSAVSPNGDPLWSGEADGEARFTPAIGKDGTIYCSTNDGRLYAFGPDGKPRWPGAKIFETQTGSAHIGASPLVLSDGRLAIAAGHSLLIVSADGDKESEHSMARWVQRPVEGPDGTIYSSCADDYQGRVDALRPDGTLLWSSEIVCDLNDPVLAPDGKLVSVSSRGRLVAFQ